MKICTKSQNLGWKPRKFQQSRRCFGSRNWGTDASHVRMGLRKCVMTPWRHEYLMSSKTGNSVNVFSALNYRERKTYLILFHPTRSLVYHTQPVSLIPYSIFIKYSYPILPYPIILKLNRIDPRPKRLGSVHHQNLPRPKSPGQNDPNSVVCTAKMLKSFGLVYSPILRLKNGFFLARIYGKIGSSPHSIKM